MGCTKQVQQKERLRKDAREKMGANAEILIEYIEISLLII